MWINFEHSMPPLNRLRTALARTPPRVHVFSPDSGDINRMTALAQDCATVAGRSWQVTVGKELPDRVDVLVISAHGSDLLAPIWNLRRQLPDAVCLVWLFDNHLSQIGNLRTVMAADGYFPSHAFCADYLFNPYSPNLGHLPAACLQWSRAELVEGLAVPRLRADRFLAAFVDYPFAARHEFLGRLGAVPEADLLLMPPGDRSRYRDKSTAERLAEWCSYKSSVVLPVERDLSTRLFDALASGQIPLVSDAVLDLDRVIPPAIQAQLPILRFRDGDIPALLAAHAEALRRFDAEGEAGLWRRVGFVLDGHLLQHRLASILALLVALDEGRAIIAYHQARGGLLLTGSSGFEAGPGESGELISER